MGKKEQWQAYIDDGLLKTGMVTKAAIHGLDGTQWATSKEFQIRTDQVTKLVSCITGDCSRLHADGIKVASESFTFTKCVPGHSLFGKNKNADAGICIYISSQAIIFGTFEKGIQHERCSGVIERMASYLQRHGL